MWLGQVTDNNPSLPSRPQQAAPSLRQKEETPAKPGLLFSDIHQPRLTGLQTVRETIST